MYLDTSTLQEHTHKLGTDGFVPVILFSSHIPCINPFGRIACGGYLFLNMQYSTNIASSANSAILNKGCTIPRRASSAVLTIVSSRCHMCTISIKSILGYLCYGHYRGFSAKCCQDRHQPGIRGKVKRRADRGIREGSSFQCWRFTTDASSLT